MVGVLIAGSRPPAHFTAVRERLLVDLADQAALAVAHARLLAGEKSKVEALEEASRLKDEFLANMSHELRTPLSGIIGFTDLLTRQLHGPLNDRQIQHQLSIRANAQRLLALINDLLDVARIESGGLDVTPVPLDVAPEIEQAVRQLAALAGEKNLAMKIEVAPDLPQVAADADRLHQVLANLLSNAIKFTPADGRVAVRATASSDAVRVDVADTGIGIAPDKLERIWERFYQVESSKSRRFGGTGLGLAIVRGLVGLMGGRVEAASPGPDQGATFSFTLPIASEASRAAPREEPAPVYGARTYDDHASPAPDL